MKLFSFIPAAALLAAALTGQGTHTAAVSAGDLIKCPDFSSVYYVGGDNHRYIFTNDKAYFSWYTNFNAVRTIPCPELAFLSIGGNVTYRPGTRLVKIQSDPRVYVIARGGVLRHIGSESVAVALFGSNWAQQVDDIADGFFINYTIGAEVMTTADYNRTSEQSAAPTINDDKRISTSY